MVQKNNSSDDELDGWKAIAEYLGVTVRTAQKWEMKRGLPVHHHSEFSMSRVRASRHELDKWRSKGGNGTLPIFLHYRWVTVLIALLLLAAAAGGASVWLFVRRVGPPAVLSLTDGWLIARDARGRVVWSTHLPEMDPGIFAHATHRLNIIEDVDGDGEREVIIDCTAVPQMAAKSRLICFSETGRIRWQFQYGDVLQFPHKVIHRHYTGQILKSIRTARGNYLLSVAVHLSSFPSQVALLDPKTGRLVDSYSHPGWLWQALVEDFDGDGATDLLLAGVNNPGPGVGAPALAMLSIPFSRAPPSATACASEFFPLTAGLETRYYLLPQPDLAEGKLHPLHLAIEGERILVRMTLEYGEIYYRVSRDFRTVDVSLTDWTIANHERLAKLGRLDHFLSQAELTCLGRLFRFDTAPDGNAFAALPEARCPPAPSTKQ